MTPRFRKGDSVRISDREEERHHRVPAYVKGRRGVVERVCCAYGQPELLGFGESGEPFQTLYRIRLKQCDLWADYEGKKDDVLEIEIFEYWLEPSGKLQS